MQLSDIWFCSFIQVSETTYALEVYIFDNTLMRIAVSENQTMDIAGNLNLASPILKVQHYMAPEVSVVLYFFTTAGLLTTALASAALSVSSASLAAAGAPSSWMSGSLAAGPSSNLLVSEVTVMLISMLVLPCFMKFLLVVLDGTKPPPTFLWYSLFELIDYPDI
jgi:hypothetical protein